ncbi:O-acyltransferase like protein [Galendromus occidentalis]|uniref:O-acyltransferase like protein n=1 Tax=Galendromus occidentalis TaxID=34638 RepID=A0AAJ7SE34_9ACAR|nr:O-acyltransferase like protein [Galendromus occidentalis]
MSAINLRFLYHFSSSKEMSRSQLRPIFLLPVVGKYGISADVLGCRDQIKERPASTGTVICGVVIGILTGLLILGTVVDIFCGNDTRGLVRVARCFSARANYLRFTNTTLTPESRRLDCLHGIRALSALWILYAHVCLKDWGNVDGILTLLWMFKSPSGVILNQFVLALETFFTLLGFSLYRLVTQERKRNNMPALKLALKVILRRAVRYIVTGMGAMAVFYVLPLITSGPGIDYMYPYLEDFCNARWWSYPIFINNLWTIQDICVENQWYTAADMQIVCILILPICLLIREPGKGIRILLYLVGGSMVYAASLTYYYGASPIFLLLPNQAIASLQLLSHLHNHSLAHLSPAAVGVLGGYLIDKYRDIDLGKTVYRAGWILYSAVIIAFGMGLIRWFLSRPNFIVLSRLSLSFYLMQWPALWLSMFSTRNPYSASHYQHIKGGDPRAKLCTRSSDESSSFERAVETPWDRVERRRQGFGEESVEHRRVALTIDQSPGRVKIERTSDYCSLALTTIRLTLHAISVVNDGRDA